MQEPVNKRQAVILAIEEGYIRGSLYSLLSRAREILLEQQKTYWSYYAGRAFVRGEDKLAAYYRSKANKQVRICYQYVAVIRKAWLKKHGCHYDMRTHKDVPGRDMYEPRHTKLKAA